jgi:hypothetical protein
MGRSIDPRGAISVSALDHRPPIDFEAPPTAGELARFGDLQARFSQTFSAIFDDPLLPRTVLIVPSLSLDQQVMAKITGVHHYEERMLCLLLLLTMARRIADSQTRSRKAGETVVR